MSRRITLAILLTVWAMLVAAGAVAYGTTRWLVLADLDATIRAQALDRPDLVPTARWRADAPTALPDGERYVMKNATDHRTLRSSARPDGDGGRAGPSGAYEPRVVSARFATADGLRVRTLTIQAWARPTGTNDPSAPPQQVLFTFSGSAEAFHHLMDRLALVLGACVLAGGGLSAGIAYVVSRAALRPLRQTAEAVGRIDERHLDRRIDPAALPPELVPVAERLNEMLARLEQAFAQRRQFLADASHELRTPVAALVTAIEVALSRPREAEAYRTVLTDALGDARHLRRLVERVMEQVRSETFDHDEPARTVDVSGLLDECADVAAALGEARGIAVERNYRPGMKLQTQPARLRSVVQNIAANAVYYNRPGGRVRLTARVSGHGLELTVADTGPGIPADQVPHLFEPFFRGDAAHQAQGHLGLGLFLVQSHLRAVGGRCTVETQGGTGTTFGIEVPPASGVGAADPSPRQAAGSATPVDPADPDSVADGRVNGLAVDVTTLTAASGQSGPNGLNVSRPSHPILTKMT